MQTFLGPNQIINRHGVKVVGPNCRVTGDNNEIIGPNALIKGNNNTVTGPNAVIHGDGNNGSGPNAVIRGNNNTWNGTNCDATGQNNNLNDSDSSTSTSRATHSSDWRNRNIVIGGQIYNSGGQTYIDSVTTGASPFISGRYRSKHNTDRNMRNKNIVVGGQTYIGATVFGGDVSGEVISGQTYVMPSAHHPDRVRSYYTDGSKEQATEKKYVEGPLASEVEHDKVAADDAKPEDTCLICLTQLSCCIVLPCRHLCLCIACSRRVVFGENGDEIKERGKVGCPQCRADAKKILRAHK